MEFLFEEGKFVTVFAELAVFVEVEYVDVDALVRFLPIRERNI